MLNLVGSNLGNLGRNVKSQGNFACRLYIVAACVEELQLVAYSSVSNRTVYNQFVTAVASDSADGSGSANTVGFKGQLGGVVYTIRRLKVGNVTLNQILRAVPNAQVVNVRSVVPSTAGVGVVVYKQSADSAGSILVSVINIEDCACRDVDVDLSSVSSNIAGLSCAFAICPSVKVGGNAYRCLYVSAALRSLQELNVYMYPSVRIQLRDLSKLSAGDSVVVYAILIRIGVTRPTVIAANLTLPKVA